MIAQRAHKFRIYPNAAQRQQLAVEFGNARFVWNTALFARQQVRLLHGRADLGERVNRKTGEVRAVKTVDAGALDAAITQLSREPGYEFLSAGTRACLTQALIDQDKAFKNFFEGRAKFPKFKGRFDKQAVRYQLDQRQLAVISCSAKMANAAAATLGTCPFPVALSRSTPAATPSTTPTIPGLSILLPFQVRGGFSHSVSCCQTPI